MFVVKNVFDKSNGNKSREAEQEVLKDTSLATQNLFILVLLNFYYVK